MDVNFFYLTQAGLSGRDYLSWAGLFILGGIFLLFVSCSFFKNVFSFLLLDPLELFFIHSMTDTAGIHSGFTRNE